MAAVGWSERGLLSLTLRPSSSHWTPVSVPVTAPVHLLILVIIRLLVLGLVIGEFVLFQQPYPSALTVFPFHNHI